MGHRTSTPQCRELGSSRARRKYKEVLLCAGCPYTHPLPWRGCCGCPPAAGRLLSCGVGLFAGALRALAGLSCWHGTVNRTVRKRAFEPLQLPGAQPQAHPGSTGGPGVPRPAAAAQRLQEAAPHPPGLEQDRDTSSPKPYWKEFRFDLAQVPAGESVTAAEFRIYKARGVSRHSNSTLHVSIYEIAAERPNRESNLFLLDAQQLRAGTEGWLVFDVTAASSHWLVERKYNLGLRLYVETDDGLSVEPGSVGLLGRRGPRSKQPFVVTFFRASASPVRATRAAKAPRRRQPKKSSDLPHPNKLPGIFDDVRAADGRQVCRRHELYVSFQDLGWLDWVIAPQGYSAYYCEGECAFPLDSCMNATNHAILQSLVHLMKPEAVPKACCAPTKLSATSVLYYDSNNNVILKKHRNMVVKSCGCH
uniref:TGF-beta family profile domain-containing protein n=1 Tax=Meleagris gallopavo TaxID=9103 RepID=A0A803YPR0_MELGA